MLCVIFIAQYHKQTFYYKPTKTIYYVNNAQ